MYAAMLVRRVQQTFDATASVAPSWPRFQRPPFAFAVIRADHAVAVFVSHHLGDAFACLVEDIKSAVKPG